MLIPMGKYVPAKRHNDLIYTSGMTPRLDGKLIKRGKIETKEDYSEYREAFRLAAKNILFAARSVLKDKEEIDSIIKTRVYINACKGFCDHPKLADFATEYFLEELGEDKIGPRAAIGVESLPDDAPVEIEAVFSIRLDK